MKLAQLMAIKSIICLVVGVLFTLVPGLLLAYFGVPNSEPSGLFFMARLYGALFILLGLILWFGRDLPEPLALRAIVPPVVIGDALGFVVALVGQLSKMMNGMGWFVVALYLLLALSYGALLLPGAVSQSQRS